ncbi:UvrABC system protein A [Paenibacillus baekrokdamisoli]|uniref:UvrABC system protein A n=1 Tax=Paenibacillus baekrokdamisoli TaxID=1712516 RepID=A0A3G9JHI8_9BACL|nr:excinuclease ABC subunit UvrA [Paenibacillus baekrokdamisoli]MBB3068454.1 excinuclease ABC subunit A [Paenibacillus baekrokdamisoli]BBH22504.1 UvrABC system protein A [Paenibacillus baekrokdamisoli]
MKKHIEVRGARQNNLQNIDVNIPRDKLTVITGVSGSGKSSLAFDVIYGEGQRRFLDSLSTYAKSRMNQVKKPEVDFVFGLSPVIAIEQKKGIINPRSTVGTMTDTYDFMRLLFASVGEASCPFCDHLVPIRTPSQMIEHIQQLPEGTELEVLAPIYKIYGETYETTFDEIRSKGFRTILIDGIRTNLSDLVELEEEAEYRMEIVVDKVIVKPDIYKVLTKTIENSLNLVGEGFIRFELVSFPRDAIYDSKQFYENFACPEHHLTMGEPQPQYFSFNDSGSACRTCGGIGTFMRAEARFLVKDSNKSINKGAIEPKLLSTSSKGTWIWSLVKSMAKHYGFDLDTPLKDMPDSVLQMLYYGTKNEKFPFIPDAGASKSQFRHEGKMMNFGGFVHIINWWYKLYLKRQGSPGESEFYKRVMIEHTCPDCEGKKMKPQRFCVRVGGADIHEMSVMSLSELQHFLSNLEFVESKVHIGTQITKEIMSRLLLLLDIGLDYLSLGRRSDTISGGEAQRIRLSTQISSGLMGMLYVLDEPSIGLHARDSSRIMNTLKKLRDLGNTIIVVEHDMDTIRSADHIIEIGPGPGRNGGHIIAEGTAEQLAAAPESVTGAFISGARTIEIPSRRRPLTGLAISIRGARANNLRSVNVDIPLGALVCITGVSGSGKSTLINEVMCKQLYSIFHDARIVPGEHDSLTGHESLTGIITIDQSPIGRSSRSNPATYVGFFDRVRELFAGEAQAAGINLSKNDFSFNQKNGGRCENCSGEGIIVTQLQFMPDVETLCPTCKGARFNEEVLDVKLNGKSIADVLDMSIEEAVEYFEGQAYIQHKLNVLNQLGLGYLRLGQSSTTLSGGEAQRIKLAYELSKMKRGSHNLYVLDEPTTGLHLSDIQKLIDCLQQLVDAGHSVLVIEHHLDLIKVADYVIDMGPDGGRNGGMIVASGTPEQVSRTEGSLTGKFLTQALMLLEEIH